MTKRTIDTPEIRKLNRQDVFNLIKENPEGLSQAQLGGKTGLSRPTIASILQELENAGLIGKGVNSLKTRGRSSMVYVCRSDARYAVGIQLTKHHISGALVDLSGTVLDTIRIRKDLNVNDEYRREIGNVFNRLLKETQTPQDRVIGVGITVQALTDFEGTKVTHIVGSNEQQILMEGLLDYIPVKGRLFHDLNALGYNSALWSESNVYYISIGNKIGSTILIGGKIYQGDHNRAGEVGHIQIVHDGKACYCGNKGCFDAYCNTDNLREFAGGNLEDFFAGLDENNESYLKYWDEYKTYLTDAVFSVHTIFDGTVVIGGDMGLYGKYYYQDLCDRLDRKAIFPDDHARDYLRISEQGNTAVATGAAMYYISHVLDEFG